MRILIVTPFDIAGIRGVCKAVVMLRREFQRLGPRSPCCCPVRAAACGRWRSARGRGRSTSATSASPSFPSAPLRALVAFVLMLPFTLLSLYRFLRRERCDVVCIQYPFPGMFYFGPLRLVSPWRLVVTFQGSDAHDLARAGRVDRIPMGVLLRAADSVVAVSQTLLAKVKQAYPGLSAPIVTIPNGCPKRDGDGLDAPVEASLPSNYILTVGLLVHRKGFDLLITALAALRDRGMPLHLVIVGAGPERASLTKLAADLGLQDRVHLVGARSHEETLALFSRCSFFVLASRAEGLPLVIVEAMAAGKAVVATAVDGIPEIVEHGRSGLLVEAEDWPALAEGVRTLHTDPALREAMGAHGKGHVARRYEWPTIASRYVTVFAETPGDRGRSVPVQAAKSP